MAFIKVNINPAVLKWAREEAGFTIEEIKEKLEVKDYDSWEEEGKNIPLGKLKKAANQYKRQLAVFFLPQVPEKIKKPKDFRNLSPSESKLSKDVLLVLRRSVRLQHLAMELKGESYWKKKYEWLDEIKALKNDDKVSNGAITSWLRKKLEITIEDQLQWKSASQAYKNWRLAVEDKLGILVFQFSMPMDELQGFCLTDNLPHVIVTNSNHSYYGRLFTIFHELAHIMRHQSGMCFMDFTNTKQKQQEEFDCNEFAADFLVPKNTVVPTENLKEITTYANKLGVSREVYLRRLKDEGLLPDIKFFSLLDQIKATYKKDNGKKSGGFVPPDIKSKASRGETFFNIVLDAVNSNHISYSDAAHALDLRVNRLIHEL